MPLARKGTPPSSKVKAQGDVLGALSAWTDEGDDVGEDEKEKDQKKSYQAMPVGEGEGGEAPAPTCRDKFDAFIDVDGDSFNMFIGLVIILNAALIGLETEFGRENFTVFEHIFNTVFCIEMSLRMHQLGVFRQGGYFCFPWYIFDFSLVVIGSLDLWVLPVLTEQGVVGQDTSNVGYNMSVMRALRIVRLMRVLRVIRLFRMFNQLYLIMNAFTKAFQVVMLIGVLVLIIDYVVAIMLTQGLGHRAHLWGEDEEKIQLWFGTIGKSMQTLFVIMTMADRDVIVLTLIKVLPSYVVIGTIVCYVMVTSYTMISLITAIITDSLITSQQEYRKKKQLSSEDKKHDLVIELREFLREVHEDDLDENGLVAGDDLKTSVRGDQELLSKLGAMGVAVSEAGILKLVDKMAASGGADGRVNADHFVDKLTNLHGMSSESEVVDLKQAAVGVQFKVKAFIAQLEKIAERKWPDENIFASAE